MPVAFISTRTSPAFGPSRSSSTISRGFLASNATAARGFLWFFPHILVEPVLQREQFPLVPEHLLGGPEHWHAHTARQALGFFGGPLQINVATRSIRPAV